jgi:RNA polymerase I-specific transcription initiation factor RRN3
MSISDRSHSFRDVSPIYNLADSRHLKAPLYTSLVRSILSLNWTIFPDALTEVYISFLGALATAQTTYVPVILSSLLEEFTDVSPSPDGRLRTALHLNAHWALQHLLTIVPSANTILLKLLRDTFPHKSAERREQVAYVYNLLLIGDYAQHLKGEILSLCVERVVQVDVCHPTVSLTVGGNPNRTRSFGRRNGRGFDAKSVQ